MADTTVVVSEDQEDNPSESEVISAVDAHIEARDAESSAEEAADASEVAEESAVISIVAADSAIESANESAMYAEQNRLQMEQLREIADSLVTSTQNILEAAQLSRGQAMEQLPEPEPEPETEPDSTGDSWYTKKLFGGGRR